jgi:hypothetical protein
MGAGVAILAVALLLSSGIAQGQRHYPLIPGTPIGACRIDVDFNQVVDSRQAVRAFIATGSTSPVILGTLNDCGWAISSFLCGPRDFNGQHGILVTIYMEVVDETFGCGVTLYQEGAQYYAAPILYTGN